MTSPVDENDDLAWLTRALRTAQAPAQDLEAGWKAVLALAAQPPAPSAPSPLEAKELERDEDLAWLTRALRTAQAPERDVDADWKALVARIERGALVPAPDAAGEEGSERAEDEAWLVSALRTAQAPERDVDADWKALVARVDAASSPPDAEPEAIRAPGGVPQVIGTTASQPEAVEGAGGEAKKPLAEVLPFEARRKPTRRTGVGAVASGRLLGFAGGLLVAAAALLYWRSGPGNVGNGGGEGLDASAAIRCPPLAGPPPALSAGTPREQQRSEELRVAAQGEAHHALAVLRIDAREHPHTPFADERQALIVHVGLCVGDEAARAEGERFLTASPTSPWAAVVRQELASPPRPVATP